VIRRLNYTGRKSIPRSRVTIRLVETRHGEPGFTADVELKGLRFPRDACVYIEAYNADSYMRFSFGTVGEPKVPSDTRLFEITSRQMPKFRLKIVDETDRIGLMLGVADRLIPLRPDENLEDKESLLPVDFRDLGERVWRLDLSDRPVLELNSRVDAIAEAARASGGFLGLLYPEVLRRILHEILFEQGVTDPNFDEDDWTSLWLRYTCSLPGAPEMPNETAPDVSELQEQWIEETVQAFCRARHARTRLEAAVARELG